MIRGVAPSMESRGGGSVLNIPALSAIQPLANFGLSVATWAGVVGLAKTLSLELGPRGIRINTLCPGLFETSRLDLADGPSAAKYQEAQKLIPLGRIGDTAEIAAVATFLSSPLASYVTGTTLAVDGGMNKSLLACRKPVEPHRGPVARRRTPPRSVGRSLAKTLCRPGWGDRRYG